MNDKLGYRIPEAAECEHEVCDASDHNHDVIGILEEEVVEARQVVA